jgi:serine/threonine protein phosphatase PrpC
MEDAHVLAALTPCTGEPTAAGGWGGRGNAAAGAAAPLSFGGGRRGALSSSSPSSCSSGEEEGGGGAAEDLLSNGGGVALARLGPRAGLRVPLSPFWARGAGGGMGAAASSFASADDGDSDGGSDAAAASSSSSTQGHLLLAGVFDGHAGHHTARQAALHLPRLVHAALVREQTALLRRGVFGGGSNGSRGGGNGGSPRQACIAGPDAAADAAEAALALAFPAFDRWWADARCDPQLTRHGWDDSGSTAVVALLAGDRLALANVGDSVALLVRPSCSSSRGGGGSNGGGGSGGGEQGEVEGDFFVRRLTVLHRADNEQEAARVLNAGGRILSHLDNRGGGGGGGGGAVWPSPSPSSASAAAAAAAGNSASSSQQHLLPRPRPRISGTTSNTRYRSAAVTRALGDFSFKAPHPLLTSEPDVASLRLRPGDDLLLLASDGVTDALTDEAVAEVALEAARRERRRLEAALSAMAGRQWRAGGSGAAGGGAGGGGGVSDAELQRALRQAAARAAADAVVREAHARGSGDDATCVAVFLDWQQSQGGQQSASGGGGGVVLP